MLFGRHIVVVLTSVFAALVVALTAARRSVTQAFSSASSSSVSTATSTSAQQKKAALLESLSVLDELNEASPERSRLIQDLCAVNPTPRPGSTAALTDPAVVSGEWRVVDAPHMATMGTLLRSRFAPVIYQLHSSNRTIVSHARVELPFPPAGGSAFWLSASGTYGSVDEDSVCRVNFDEAWIRRIDGDDDGGDYYPSIDAVPESPLKELVRRVGRTFFIEPFAVFPVSYLDSNLCVFDFELLGTRICAYKQ